MLPFQIKVCGISKPDDAICACEAGADAIGLNFYEKSVRFVDDAAAKRVVDAVAEFNAANGTKVKTIGVFVNKSEAEIVRIQQAVGLDGIQLHGNEEPECFSSIIELFGEAWGEKDIDLIRAIRPKQMVSSDNGSAVSGGTANQEQDISSVSDVIKRWTQGRFVSILIDAHVPGEFGGTGKKVDWSSVPQLVETSGTELVLAGGLNSWNVKEAIEVSKVKAVDVASGVESTPGVKDRDQILKFVTAALGAFA